MQFHNLIFVHNISMINNFSYRYQSNQKMVPWKFLTFLILLAFFKSGATAVVDHNLALKFGNTLNDFVKFGPDMHPVKDTISICAWVKRQSSNSSPTWFTYWTSSYIYEIVISDNGIYNFILQNNFNVGSSVTVPMNYWTHYCMTWSSSSNKNSVYYNGTLIGSKQVASRSITLGGYVVLGHDKGSIASHEIFGGQLFKLNVFAKELTGGEVKEMWESGMCSEVEENYGRARYLKWEDILLEPRQGDVTEVETRCYREEREVSSWDILYSERFFNKLFTDQLLKDLRSSDWDL